MRSARALPLVLTLAGVGCGTTRGPGTQPVLDRDDPRAAPLLDEYRAAFALAWDGHPLGWARERLTRRAGGFSFERRERWRVARDGAIMVGALRIVIDTDGSLTARRVALWRDGHLGGQAVRDGAARWLIRVPGQPARRVTGRAVPAELVPLWLARRRQARWYGPVLLPGLGFATASLSVTPVGPRTRLVELRGEAGASRTHVHLAVDGTVERAGGPDLTEWRVEPGTPGEPGDPGEAAGDPREAAGAPPVGAATARSAAPDLVALGSLPVDGPPGPAVELTRGTHTWRVALSGLPPELAPAAGSAGPAEPAPPWPPPAPDPPPSPAMRALADRIVTRARATAPLDQARALVQATARLLTGDLEGDPAAPATQVLARGRADCVGHAVLLSALARARGLRVRLVIGFHLDGARLWRHEWAAIDAGGGHWVAVDPTTGDAPALAGRYLALAAHGSAPAERALAAELAYAGLRGVRARFVATSGFAGGERRCTGGTVENDPAGVLGMCGRSSSAQRSARSTPRTP